MTKVTYTYKGYDQVFTVPNGVSEVFIQAWGAAGGSQVGAGGAGGYSQGTLAVSANQEYTVIVGQGGINWSTSQVNCILPTYGGGGAGGSSTEVFKGSSGGGRSAVRLSTTEIITAGGGGGSSSSYAESGGINAGSGGGTLGYAAIAGLTCYNVAQGKGGTQSAGGTGGTGWTTFNNGITGTAFTGGTGGGGSNGGTSAGAGGGGGGGYFGGGGGAGSFQSGLGCPPSAGSQDVSGGGGSGFIGLVSQGLTLATTITAATSAPINPPFTTDPNYVAGVGVAPSSGVGGNGLVVFTYTLPTSPTLTKYVDKSIATIGDILNYTIVLNNTLNLTYNNIVFIDTIPNSTTFNSGSLSVNGSPVAGNPNPPGVSLGDSSNTITITFSVTVITVPTPNPIPNSAALSASNLSSVASNIVTTNINYINLLTSKIVNKSYAAIGSVLTYTIPITNSGNTTVNSLVFLDTIPNGTTLVTGSFKQDGVTVTGTPNTNTTLPNNLKVGGVTTVTFQVTVTTIPVPNPIPNTASILGNYIVDSTTTPNRVGSSSTSTNTVNTQVNTASLGNITKSVDKSYATCGDVLTYTILIPNSGNVTAFNVIFKDTIPNGTALLPTTVYINGVQQSGANFTSGVTVPNITPGTIATVNFSVQIQC